VLKNILFVTFGYPTPKKPNKYIFLQQLVATIAQLGVHCTVINPVKLWSLPALPIISKVHYPGSGRIKIIRPRFPSFSTKSIGGINTSIITQWMFERAAMRAVNMMNIEPDAFYGHFLYHGGAAAVNLGKKNNKPSFVAAGESVSDDREILWSLYPFGLARAQNDFRDVSGMIAVSKLLEQTLQDQLKINEDRIRVFPNGVDLSVFFQREKKECRTALGLPQEKFIAIFVGTFNHNKGVDRLLEAVKGFKTEIGLVLLGDGPIKPEGTSIYHKGIVAHQQVAEWLSAADVFVLPTLAEGSSNSILEAMACGLPIISSKGDFNTDIMDDTVGISVNPTDISEIRNAIIKLKNDQDLRQAMSIASLEKAKQFDIQLRASNILSWMEMMIQ